VAALNEISMLVLCHDSRTDLNEDLRHLQVRTQCILSPLQNCFSSWVENQADDFSGGAQQHNAFQQGLAC